MDKTYKSSTGALIRNFIVILIYTIVAVFFIIGGASILFDLRNEEIFAPFAVAIYGIIAGAFSIYFSFIRHNIIVQIKENEVTLYRGNKVYASFSTDEYILTSFVSRTISNVGIYTSRFLRTINKKTGKWKDYRLYFSKKTFEEFIAVVTSLNKDDDDADQV